ncbi:S53 family peptidase, partial [Candidatus Woesebacteria bacterium]|nr:S53 family peptidase [Candidatus Woesebacteria bacterium]
VTLFVFKSSPIFADSSARDLHQPVCPGENKGDFRCHARVITDSKGNPKITTTPSGYGPQQFRSAYNLSGITSTNQTIAIVDAYDQPYILSDLNKYSSQFGIPQMQSCPVSTGTTLQPCFQKVSQNGDSRFPGVNAGWALETSLDVEAAHAICQNCNILLVEAYSNSYADLMKAVDQAHAVGATVISNSYGSQEFSGETSFDSHFNLPGTAITFSSGDSGYGAGYPASSPFVTAVGGTTLNLSGNTYVSETVWNGSGSGCSLYETTKPVGQPVVAGCTNRIVADVSADADPNTGAAVYDSVRYQGRKGWFKVGGTSLSSPLIAGVYALSGNTTGYANSLPYSLGSYSTNLRDVINGSTFGCDGTFLCKATVNYDGPTGVGTPFGFSAF